MGQVWQIEFDALHSMEAEEDGLFSDGDEPLVAVIAFTAAFGRRDSVSVWRTPLNNDAWPKHFSAGDAIPLPKEAGIITFPRIDTKEINVLGTAVIAIEHDNTPLSTIGGLLDRAVNALREQLLRLMGDAKLSLLNADERQRQIDGAVSEVKDAIKVSGLAAIAAWIGSGFDPDDASEPVVTVYTNVKGVADDLVDNQQIVLDLRYVHIEDADFLHSIASGSFPSSDTVPIIPSIAFPDGSFHYQLSGRLKMIDHDPEFVTDDTDPQCRSLSWDVVTLPELFESIKGGHDQGHVEITLTDDAHGVRTAFGSDLHYDPGHDDPGSYPFTPAGHYGEKLTMNTVECAGGRITNARWNARILFGAEPPFGGPDYYSAVIIVDDVNVYYQPLAQAGQTWEGSDPSSRIQIVARRVRPPR
jgi:hypothetical protein